MRVSKHGPGRRAVGLRRSPPADKEAKSQRDKGAITRRGKTRSRYSSSQRVAPARPPQLTCCVMCVSRQRRLRRQGGLRLGRARRFIHPDDVRLRLLPPTRQSWPAGPQTCASPWECAMTRDGRAGGSLGCGFLECPSGRSCLALAGGGGPTLRPTILSVSAPANLPSAAHGTGVAAVAAQARAAHPSPTPLTHTNEASQGAGPKDWVGDPEW